MIRRAAAAMHRDPDLAAHAVRICGSHDAVPWRRVRYALAELRGVQDILGDRISRMRGAGGEAQARAGLLSLCLAGPEEYVMVVEHACGAGEGATGSESGSEAESEWEDADAEDAEAEDAAAPPGPLCVIEELE